MGVETIFKPKVVLALIENEGKFVLIRRKIPSLKVEWAFPGGVTEPGETEEESAKREAKQEVGIEVVVKEKLLERKHPNTYVEIAYFYCEPVNAPVMPVVGEPDEIVEAEWVPAEEVMARFTSDVHPKIKEFIESKILK